MTTIETPRLLLRRWRDEDLLPFAAINADPEVMRWIGDGSAWDEARTREALKRIETHWDELGFGLFAVEVKETGELAGFTGLSVPHFLPEVMPAVEIGWRLGRPFWGQGLATEAARAALDQAFRGWGLERVVSILQIGNLGSERIMVKLGMRRDRDLIASGTGRETRVYALTAEEYAAP
ncbi:GNAT family N-acetyltransferase [Streptacidiphilus sp. P02-A3a]|uniref:GNAT family N-acetyltransferase n=1 Tax=Streptacidiphilus sp. P02-A3a TaxID=2704468 RepID=UPI0015FE6337|nr:GNAT family N-acetyltransferase [Streptacidiphilus sp. P02-A3a]QMU68074.1 GNAT family N-acetyltransferase [Streptacidiphilus sp. P02-A3a]